MMTMGFARVDTLLHIWRFTLLLFLLVRSCALNLDGALLLSFKYSVLSDPLSVLDNWDYSSESPCSWTGVTCAQIRPSLGSPDMFRVISLILPNSQLLGSIPEEVGFIQHLRTVDLSGNFLNGTLPGSLFNSSELQVISLSDNKIYGELPELGGLSGLRHLNLSDNALAGTLPGNLTSLWNLTIVSLRSNYFSGSVPSGFDVVEVLDLSSNLFNGSLLDDFGGKSLTYLNLSYNKLSGSISSKFAEKISASARIDLSFNNLTGEIPESTALLNQKTESFSGNLDLCGKPLKKQCTIPSTLSVPPKVNSTSTPAIAAIPKTINSSAITTSNPPTSNGQHTQQQSRMKPGTVAGILVGGLAGIGILAMIILYVYQLKKKKKEILINKDQVNGIKEDPVKSKDSKGHSTWSCLVIENGEETSEATGSDSDENTTTPNNNKNGVLGEYYGKEPAKERSLVMVDGETEVDLETLLKASAYILGSTGSNIVYKAVLADGTAFAVRRIGEGGVERRRRREFENLVRALAKLRHPNLVRVRGFYWAEDEKLVIYDYVSNGSLAAVSAGYNKIGTSPCHLTFQVRLRIAKGVARGLSYIHEKKNVHGNIKPNNILLNPDLDPVISDFGLDRLISANHHHHSCAGGATRHFGSKRSSTDLPTSASPHTSFVGCTSPYHAPESLENLKPNLKWDVYSFGIVLLELLTGKVFSDRELSQWTAGSAVEEKYRILRMADVAIRADLEGREDAMVACFKLGLSCASLVPQKRPSMKDALQVLEKLPCTS